MGLPARASSALLTDLYQLTMAEAYRASGIECTQACFHLFFRSNPFGGGYSIACGLEQAVDFIGGFRFDDGDLAYLAEAAMAAISAPAPGSAPITTPMRLQRIVSRGRLGRIRGLVPTGKGRRPWRKGTQPLDGRYGLACGYDKLTRQAAALMHES